MSVVKQNSSEIVLGFSKKYLIQMKLYYNCNDSLWKAICTYLIVAYKDVPG